MNIFIMFIYWNGRNFDRPQGCIFYDDKRPIKIERGLSYNVLKKKFAAKLKLQSYQKILSLTYRFLIARYSSTYTTLKIIDDDDIDYMISTFGRRCPLMMLKLYAEIDIASSSFLPIDPSIHFAHDINKRAPLIPSCIFQIELIDKIFFNIKYEYIHIQVSKANP